MIYTQQQASVPEEHKAKMSEQHLKPLAMFMHKDFTRIVESIDFLTECTKTIETLFSHKFTEMYFMGRYDWTKFSSEVRAQKMCLQRQEAYFGGAVFP